MAPNFPPAGSCGKSTRVGIGDVVVAVVAVAVVAVAVPCCVSSPSASVLTNLSSVDSPIIYHNKIIKYIVLTSST